MSKRPPPDSLKTDTLGIRTGELPTEAGAHSEVLYLTSSFVFRDAAEAAARFSGDEPGNIYSRFTNPTVQAFEQRLAAMEGGERCVAFASGMASITATFMALMEPGEHIVSSRGIFGTTVVLYEKYLKKFGIETTMVDLADMEQWRRAIRPETRFLFVETPSNPLVELCDIRALADLAHEHGAQLIVDNCFCTPVLQKPFELGADLVIHSATKYLDGQGRCVGGAVIGPGETMDELHGFLRTTGASMSPFNAWVFLKGLETLPLRMRAHSVHAMELASWLVDQPGVEKVYYAGLEDHPQHELARTQQKGFGGVLSFLVRDSDGRADRQAAWRFIDATRLVSITANLGDAKTTITHPASTTHGRVPDEEKRRAGIAENLVRVAVGLEDPADIREDMARGVAALGHK